MVVDGGVIHGVYSLVWHDATVAPFPSLLADTIGFGPRASGRLAILNARLFDGRGSAPRLVDAIVIDEGRFVSVGTATPLDGVATIDAGGRFVMPGLIDVHVHLSILEHSHLHPHPPNGAEPLYPGLLGHLVAATLRRCNDMGVTTIRDVGAYGDVVLEARQAMRYGAFDGPRLLACGRIISPTSPGGRFFDGMYAEADGVDEIRKAVRQQFRRGADFVKIMTTGARSVELEDSEPSQAIRDEVATVVEEAHRQGYRVAAHCEGLPGTALAVEEGVDTIEHGMFLHERPDLLDQMAERGAVLVPTLEFLHNVAENGTWTPELIERGKLNIEAAHRTLQAALSRGVRIAVGLDTPEADKSAIEYGRLVEHGMKAIEAMTAHTRGGAYALGLSDEIGTIEVDKRADCMIVDGDPLLSPAVLLDSSRIRRVFRNGVPVGGAEQ